MGLKGLVIGMGVLIVIGLAVVLADLVERSLVPGARPPVPGEAGGLRWQLPPDAKVREWRVAGDELVVRLEQDGAALFWTFDRRSGQRLGEVRLEPGSNP